MRKLAVLIHRYLGLLLGSVLLLSAVTGSAIVFNRELDTAFNPDLLRVEPQADRVPVDLLVARARDAAPHRQASFVFLPVAAGQAVEVWFRDTDARAYLDPHTGELLGLRHAKSSLMGFLADLHIHLLSGETGERIVGWVGLGGMLVSMLGLWLWWPRRGRWKQAFQVKRGAAPARLWLDIHKLIGAVTFLLFMLTAGTGAALALYDIITEPLLVAATGEGARRSAPRSSVGSGKPAPLAPMLEQAAAMFPDGRITRITLPQKRDAAVGIRMRLEGEIHQFGRTFIWFDQHDGKVLRIDNALQANLATRIQSWLYPLHTGVYGGLPTWLLQIVTGMSLAVMILSGAWLWYRSYRARTAAAKRRNAIVT